MTPKTLRKARLRAGLTQTELARLAGLTEVTVSRAEGGVHRTTELTWAKLQRAVEEYEAARAEARQAVLLSGPPQLP